jgi:hypothetical protein
MIRSLNAHGTGLAAGLIAAVFAFTALATPALASDALTLAEAAADTGANECPVLTQVKYPFLRCTTDAHGVKEVVKKIGSASYTSDRQVPRLYEFVEGTPMFPFPTTDRWLRSN